MTINGIKPRSLNRHRDIPIKEIKLCPPYWLVPTKIFNIPALLPRNVRRETAKAVQHEWWFWVSLSIKSHPSTKEREEKSLYFGSNRIGNPSIIYLLLAWYAAIGQQIHEKPQHPASYSTEKFFYSCIINDLCQKIHESNTFSSDFFFNFHPIYKFKSWNGYYFFFLLKCFFFFKTVSPWYTMELSYPVYCVLCSTLEDILLFNRNKKIQGDNIRLRKFLHLLGIL